MSGRITADARYGQLRLPDGAGDEMGVRVGPEVASQAVTVGACRRLHGSSQSAPTRRISVISHLLAT